MVGRMAPDRCLGTQLRYSSLKEKLHTTCRVREKFYNFCTSHLLKTKDGLYPNNCGVPVERTPMLMSNIRSTLLKIWEIIHITL